MEGIKKEGRIAYHLERSAPFQRAVSPVKARTASTTVFTKASGRPEVGLTTSIKRCRVKDSRASMG
jgi:hypothetical protein